RLIVPFASDESLVAAARKSFRPAWFIREIRRNAEQSAASQQHRARRHANRALHRAHAIGSRKRGAITHEAIEMRRLNVAIAERRDGVGPLIVAEEKKNVERTSLRQVRSRLCPHQTTEQGSDKQRDAFHGFFSSSNAVVLSLNFP